MKKYISIILITMMLFSILTACKNNNPDLPIDDPDGFNFNGDFILWSPWSAEYKFETRGYNVSGDRIMDRYQEMKDLYNLNIQERQQKFIQARSHAREFLLSTNKYKILEERNLI